MGIYNVKKILIPVDFSKTSFKALDIARIFSEKTNAEVILLHVTEDIYTNLEPNYFQTDPSVSFINFRKEFAAQSDSHLAKLSGILSSKGIEEIKTETRTGNIAKEILEAAKNHRVDLIVMGTHGVSGIKEFFIGSNTFRVIRDAKCPVLSVPLKTKVQPIKNILVPFRDKPHSREKVNFAIDMAEIFSSTIYILGIDTEFTEAHKRKIKLEADQIKNIITKRNIESRTKVISKAYAGEEVLKYAKAIEADLIISMSDLDKMNIKEYFTGPFAQQIVNHSTIPVLSIRPKFNTDTIDLRFY